MILQVVGNHWCLRTPPTFLDSENEGIFKQQDLGTGLRHWGNQEPFILGHAAPLFVKKVKTSRIVSSIVCFPGILFTFRDVGSTLLEIHNSFCVSTKLRWAHV